MCFIDCSYSVLRDFLGADSLCGPAGVAPGTACDDGVAFSAAADRAVRPLCGEMAASWGAVAASGPSVCSVDSGCSVPAGAGGVAASGPGGVDLFRSSGSRYRCMGELVGYTLPRLHTGKSWFVDFSCWDPVAGRMRRKRYYLNRLRTARERYDRASELISVLTLRLRAGWNVWVRVESAREYTLLSEAVSLYRVYCERMAERGQLKRKSMFSYRTYLGMLMDWLEKRAVPVRYCWQLDEFLLSDFLEHILIDRESSARTRNNYWGWLSSFCSWMVRKGFLKENPAARIPKLREEPKRREALSEAELVCLREYLEVTDRYFLLACLMEYYTFIRPIELVQIRLEDISVSGQCVFVAGCVSKNRRDGMVGLNDRIIRLMLELRVFDHPGCCYLFGRGFRPSERRADGRIFRDYFMKVRAALHWGDEKQFYSLKDSGIRDLANAEGVVVARDQARHSDVSTTNRYLKGGGLTVHEETKHFRGAF